MAIRVPRRLKYFVVLAVITLLLYDSLDSPQLADFPALTRYKSSEVTAEETYDGVFDTIEDVENAGAKAAPKVPSSFKKESAPVDFEIPEQEKGSPESVPIRPEMPISSPEHTPVPTSPKVPVADLEQESALGETKPESTSPVSPASKAHTQQESDRDSLVKQKVESNRPGQEESSADDSLASELAALRKQTSDAPSENLLPTVKSRPIADDEKFQIGRKEMYPVAKNDLIRLTSGASQKIPKIQAADPSLRETKQEKQVRLERQMEIRDVFKRDWAAYKRYAWMHDELKPVSNASKDPFGGWGATLVDALDTMIIMDLEEQYREASEAVAKIDFTYTVSRAIPLFETTIRYLGGLLSAYDLGVAKGHKDSVMLSQAKTLGQVLYGAFDTPNRMPLLRYDYRYQARAKRTMRSPASGCMAEVGSLSVEFTRLAQLSDGDDRNKFFDAVQRVTNELENSMSFMDIPGLWPLQLDLSGCAPRQKKTKPTVKTPNKSNEELAGLVNPVSSSDGGLAKSVTGSTSQASNKDPSENMVVKTPNESNEGLVKDNTKLSTEINLEKAQKATNDLLDVLKDKQLAATQKGQSGPTKRQLRPGLDMSDKPDAEEVTSLPEQHQDNSLPDIETESQCIAQGIRIAPGARRIYSQGGQADSTYEYFTKEYLLLGGGKYAEQYQSLYEKSIEATKKHLLFKPLVPEGLGAHQLLMAGDAVYSGKKGPRLETKMQHLTCFIGGMFAMGAKVFSRPDDLLLAAKLTDGCVWAYNYTAAGVAPECFHLHECKDDTCSWQDFMDEHAAQNTAIPSTESLSKAPEWAAEVLAIGEAGLTAGSEPEVTLTKRAEPETRPDALPDASDANTAASLTTKNFEKAQEEKARTPAKAIQPDEDYTKAMFWIDDRYILRPEAIESVWYMYRITGDKSWQEKGWQMWRAVESLTRTQTAHSAVTHLINPDEIHFEDSLESFWFAETLKYFYLLFSDFDTVSLDEYVLNTEAHPLKRPAT